MIEHIILFGISTLFWSNLFSEFKEFNDIKTYDNYKLIRNKFSSIHAHGSVITCLIKKYIIDFNFLPFMWSYGYFFYDLLLCIKNYFNKKNKNKFLSFAYIIHHIFSILEIYFIKYDKYKNLGINILMLAELSNLPGYYIYKEIATNNNDSFLCKFMRTMQIIIYPIIRIFCFGYLIYKNKNLIPKYLYPGVFIIYIMGLVWSFKLMKNYKLYLKKK